MRNCQLPSSQATPKTLSDKSKELNKHRRVSSGEEQAFQLSKEVKACTLEDRQKILQGLQDGFKVQIPTSCALAMKADLGISWDKLRAIILQLLIMHASMQTSCHHHQSDDLIYVIVHLRVYTHKTPR